VEATVAEAQISALRIDCQPGHVSLDELHLDVGKTCGATLCATQHRGLEIDSNPVHALAGTHATQRDPAPTRDIEDRCPVGELAHR
jgi:hypothetical protein